MNNILFSQASIPTFFALSLCVLAVPLFVLAQTTNNPGTTQDQFPNQGNGLFNCNQTSAYGTSVGAFSAIGGVYVPVNDAAVTLNTGYLVYKECILRNVIKRQGEVVTAGLASKTIQIAQTGRGGAPLYAQDIPAEYSEANLRAVTLAQKDRVARRVNPAVDRALLRSYINETVSPNVNACPYQNNGSIWNDIMVGIGNQNCNSVGQYMAERSRQERFQATAIDCLEKEWAWGRGWRGVNDNDPDSVCGKILTPPSVVQNSFQNTIDSPLRQAESANDIGQLISPLYSNLAAQALGDLKGLAGLLQPQGGQLSYLDRMVKQTSNNLQTAAINAAINTLNAVNGVESAYLAAKTALARKLETTIVQLRTAESQCWNTIISKVCTSPVANDNTCTRTITTTTTTPGAGPLGSGGNTQTTTETFTLQIATTTTASQSVIDAQISPVATQVAEDIKASESAVQMLAVLSSQAVSASTTLRQTALRQVDTLVSRGVLHSQYDLTQAQKQRDDASLLLTQLVQDTVESWVQSSDPVVGWCNTGEQSVLNSWIAKWKE